MKTRETSITAYTQEKTRNQTKKQRILTLIKEHPAITDHTLMNLTGWPRNVVSARRNELAAEGRIVEDSVVFDCETKKKVTAWRAR